jgi:hypothetical protein
MNKCRASAEGVGSGVFSLYRFRLISNFLTILVPFRYELRSSPLTGREFQAVWPGDSGSKSLVRGWVA